MKCPNINTKEYKELESKVGKKEAYRLYLNTNQFSLNIDSTDKPNEAILKIQIKNNSNNLGYFNAQTYTNLQKDVKAGKATYPSVLSIDEYDTDVLAVNAASLAVATSHIPFNGPVSSMRIGLEVGSDTFIVNPTYAQRTEGVKSGRIRGSRSASIARPAK